MHLRLIVIIVCIDLALAAFDRADAFTKKPKAGPSASPAMAAAQQYAAAIASDDRVAVGQLDFACQYDLAAAASTPRTAFPPASDPSYARCWDTLSKLHDSAVVHQDASINVLWPGPGSLVFFRENLTEYASSFFVMDRLGLSPPAGGLTVEPLGSAPLPAASFRLRAGGPILSATATMVRLRVTYKDPLTSPVTFAPSEDFVTRKAKRVRQALKGVSIQWVVLSGLRKLGLPGDVAVVNVPTKGPAGDVVPFVTATSGYIHDTRQWWLSGEASGLLIGAVGRASQLPEPRDRLALLNRVLLINPAQPEALVLLTNDLLQALLSAAAAAHRVPIEGGALAARFNELYWNIYSQNARTEIAETMEVGQRAQATPGDYLYRMLWAMEKLAAINPEDRENRLRLGIAYRWNNDYESAIAVHEALANEKMAGRAASLRGRILVELAWSRIAHVAWSRRFSSPDLGVAYQEAEEALKLAESPLDKFTAAYTMAYSVAFKPDRNNKQMLDLLTEARRWYQQVPGATSNSWSYLLRNDTLKGVIDTDPSFQSLFVAS